MVHKKEGFTSVRKRKEKRKQTTFKNTNSMTNDELDNYKSVIGPPIPVHACCITIDLHSKEK